MSELMSTASIWQKNNRARASANLAAWKARNPEKVKEQRRAYRAANPKKQTHDKAMQRARALNAVPPWVDVKAIREFYDACPHGFEVDHIYPLKHRLCCGLHVPWNLQYLTRSENARKNQNAKLEEIKRCQD
jgi:hypothetical protein